MIFYVVTLTVGFLLSIQSGLNSSLSKSINSSVWAAIISFSVGLCVLLAYAAVSQTALPSKKSFDIPYYFFIGGALGALYVLSAIILFPKIGAANLVIFTVLGQLICSLLLDHFGWLGATPRPINWQKIAAIITMLASVIWFQKS